MAGIYPVAALGWEKLLTGSLAVHEIPGDHLTMLDEPTVEIFAQQLKTCLEAAPCRIDDR
jgi:thioesterase domain-containing protein